MREGQTDDEQFVRDQMPSNELSMFIRDYLPSRHRHRLWFSLSCWWSRILLFVLSHLGGAILLSCTCHSWILDDSPGKHHLMISLYLPLIITFRTNFEFPALSIIFAEWWKKMVMGVYLSAWFGQTVVWPGIFILRFCDYCWSNTKYQFKPTHFQSNCSWLGQCHPVSFIIWILLHCY